MSAWLLGAGLLAGVKPQQRVRAQLRPGLWGRLLCSCRPGSALLAQGLRQPEMPGRQDATGASCSQGLGAVGEPHGGSRAESSQPSLSQLQGWQGTMRWPQPHLPGNGDVQRPGVRRTMVRHGPGCVHPAWGVVPWPDTSTAGAQLETSAMKPR